MSDPIHGLCNMHRYLVSEYAPNLVTVRRAIPKLQLSVQFWHPSHGTHYLLEWTPNGPIPTVIKVCLNGPIPLWRPPGNRMNSLGDISSPKPLCGRVEPGMLRFFHLSTEELLSLVNNLRQTKKGGNATDNVANQGMRWLPWFWRFVVVGSACTAKWLRITKRQWMGTP